MRRHFGAVAVLVVGLLNQLAGARADPSFTRVRPLDPQARALLLDAWQSSGTVRALIETLEHSDLIVLIESRHAVAALRGSVHLMSATPERRFLRVSVKVSGWRERLLPALAHELQHAVEIARAPEVINKPALAQLFRRIGHEWDQGLFETEAALAIEEKVRLEVTSVSRRRP